MFKHWRAAGLTIYVLVFSYLVVKSQEMFLCSNWLVPGAAGVALAAVASAWWPDIRSLVPTRRLGATASIVGLATAIICFAALNWGRLTLCGPGQVPILRSPAKVILAPASFALLVFLLHSAALARRPATMKAGSGETQTDRPARRRWLFWSGLLVLFVLVSAAAAPSTAYHHIVPGLIGVVLAAGAFIWWRDETSWVKRSAKALGGLLATAAAISLAGVLLPRVRVYEGFGAFEPLPLLSLVVPLALLTLACVWPICWFQDTSNRGR